MQSVVDGLFSIKDGDGLLILNGTLPFFTNQERAEQFLISYLGAGGELNEDRIVGNPLHWAMEKLFGSLEAITYVSLDPANVHELTATNPREFTFRTPAEFLTDLMWLAYSAGVERGKSERESDDDDE